MGHLNRAYAIGCALKQTHGITPLVLTTSSFLPQAITGALPIVRWPTGGFADTSPWNHLLRDQIKSWIESLSLDALVADTFAHGPENELLGLSLPRWVIQREGQSPESTRHFLVNPQGVGYVLNTPPAQQASRLHAQRYWGVDPNGAPLLVVAHNGDTLETRSFFEWVLGHLQGAPYQVRLASLLPCLKPEWTPIWRCDYPLAHWYAGVDLLLGGGGYNLVTEARCYGLRRYLCAFERPVDRQWERIQFEPHFYWGISRADFLACIERLLAADAPAALPSDQIQGAEQIARVLAESLSKS